MDLTSILEIGGNAIYAVMGLVALYGVFLVIFLLRRIAQKRFSSRSAEEAFLEEVRVELEARNFDGVAELCDSPRYWAKAVPQLILVALENRKRSPAKIRRLLAEKFERDVLADLEYRLSWINTIVKSAPMLGLLGTVVGMINAFGKIAAASQTGADPSKLANDISFALFTTALGLTIAIPLVLAGAMINVRIGKLQDSV
ncbi:MAG: MotA/TolQ/ExbB proton channel family protein, partial [Planctomycetes bacterium]|nr:MotA/TolQ/ExbB proton channel family protein [Planctomycetota bacterium]